MSDTKEYCLCISEDYADYWTSCEALRELVQNSIDSCIFHIASNFDEPSPRKLISYNLNDRGFYVTHPSEERSLATITFDNEGNRMIIYNVGTIKSGSLFMGGTTRVDSKGNVLVSDTVGRFGEGMKIALVIFLRQGGNITIETGKYLWKFCLRRPDFFDDIEKDILHVSIVDMELDSYTSSTKVVIELNDIENIWFDTRNMFLFSDHPDSIYRPLSSEGCNILLDQDFKGLIYAKGTKVGKKGNLLYGYDFVDLDLNRDRRAPLDKDQLERKIRQSFKEYIESLDPWTYEDFMDKCYSTLCSGKSTLEYDTILSCNQDSIEYLYSKFIRRNTKGGLFKPMPIVPSKLRELENVTKNFPDIEIVHEYVPVEFKLFNILKKSKSYVSHNPYLEEVTSRKLQIEKLYLETATKYEFQLEQEIRLVERIERLLEMCEYKLEIMWTEAVTNPKVHPIYENCILLPCRWINGKGDNAKATTMVIQSIIKSNRLPITDGLIISKLVSLCMEESIL